jgi:hypothetical protein
MIVSLFWLDFEWGPCIDAQLQLAGENVFNHSSVNFNHSRSFSGF